MTLSRSFYSTQTTAFDYLQARAPRELWSAVLQQAIADIVDGPAEWELRGLSLAEQLARKLEFATAAQHWVDDEENEPRRFVWVCEQLGLNPSAVRAKIKGEASGISRTTAAG